MQVILMNQKTGKNIEVVDLRAMYWGGETQGNRANHYHASLKKEKTQIHKTKNEFMGCIKRVANYKLYLKELFYSKNKVT